MTGRAPEVVDRRVLAVVVTYQSADHIGRCLDELLASAVTEVVVWDNGSRDGTGDVVRSRQDVRLRLVEHAENLGFAKAVNRAVGAATSSFDDLVLVNPDCVVTAATVSALQRALDEHPDVGLVVPAMSLPEDRRGVAGGAWPSIVKECLAASRIDEVVPASAKRTIVRALTRLGAGGNVFVQHESARSAQKLVRLDWVSGFCLMIRGPLWRTLGGLDERFFLYFEDVALCRRAAALGWTSAVAGNVTAYHLESASSTTAGKSAAYRSAFRTYLRHYGTPLQQLCAATPGRSWS